MRHPLALLVAAGCAPSASHLDLATADALVVDEVLPGLVPDDGPYTVVRLPAPVPAGEVLKPAAEPPTEPTAFAPDEPLAAPSWIYVLDPAPGTLWFHDVSWIVVDDAGEVAVVEADAPPVAETVDLAALDAWPPAAANLVASSFDVAALQAEPPAIDVGAFEIRRPAETIIVVDGTGTIPAVDPTSPAAPVALAALDVHDLFDAWRTQQTEADLVRVVDGGGAAVTAAIDAAAGAGDESVTVVLASPYATQTAIQLAGGWLSVVALRDAVRTHPALRFQLLLAFGASPVWFDVLAAEPNVDAVVTATDALGYVYRDHEIVYPSGWGGGAPTVDVDPSDRGLEFVSAWVGATRTFIADNDAYTPVRTFGVANGISDSAAMLCLGARGAVGELPDLGLERDLDVLHAAGVVGWRVHCTAFED